jgi:hypothetical protein
MKATAASVDVVNGINNYEIIVKATTELRSCFRSGPMCYLDSSFFPFLRLASLQSLSVAAAHTDHFDHVVINSVAASVVALTIIL